jgi:hypothetical protein
MLEELELLENEIMMTAFNHPNQHALEAQPAAILWNRATGESFASMKRCMKERGFVGRGSVDRFVEEALIPALKLWKAKFEAEQTEEDRIVKALLDSVGDPLSDSDMS